MITTHTMGDDEVTFLKGKEQWIDGTSLMTSLAPMNNMVDPFLRSARTGNNLLLVDQSIAGTSGPRQPGILPNPKPCPNDSVIDPIKSNT